MLVERIQDASDWITLELNDNRRSHSKITKCFSVLRTEGEPEVKPVTQFDVEYPILVVKYSKDNEFEAVEKFYSKCNVLEDNHVVVRGRSLRNKLYGNTYPEKSLWNSPLPEALIAVKKSFEVSEIKKAVSRLRSLTPTVLEPNCDLSRRLEIEDELRDDYEARALLFYIGRNLPSFDLTVEDWTRETGRFLLEALATKLDVPNSIDFGLKKGKYKKLYSQRLDFG